MSRNIEKYLSKYAEPQICSACFDNPLSFESVLVIPVYDEPFSAIERLIQRVSIESVALVLVFNVPDLSSPSYEQSAALNRTEEVLSLIRKQYHFESVGSYELASHHCASLYILDRTIHGSRIPPKQGVGLARKLGLDFALKLCFWQEMNRGILVNWIHSSDADVILPDRYFDLPEFDRRERKPNTSALIYPFQHRPEAGYERAMSLYDFSLRYYVEQLEKAGSPYAFHTIGSLIVVNNEAYATVRGIPKRSGGEDFYLLNKLAKVGKIRSLDSPVINIAGRPSHRVPFGTGPAISKIAAMDNPEEDYRFYHPEIFVLLKQLLMIVSEAEQIITSSDILIEELEAKISAQDARLIVAALSELNIEKQYKQFEQKQTKEGFIAAFHTWFDAFVTLRFVHIMRDLAFPNVRLKALPEAIRNRFTLLDA